VAAHFPALTASSNRAAALPRWRDGSLEPDFGSCDRSRYSGGSGRPYL